MSSPLFTAFLELERYSLGVNYLSDKQQQQHPGMDYIIIHRAIKLHLDHEKRMLYSFKNLGLTATYQHLLFHLVPDLFHSQSAIAKFSSGKEINFAVS